MPVNGNWNLRWVARLSPAFTFYALSWLAFAPIAGCGGPNAQVRRIQSEKDELLATIRQQRDANRTLQTEVASLEQRLDEAETVLAGGKPRTQLSRAPAASTVSASASTAQRQPPEDALPWRPHRGTSQPAASVSTLVQLSRQDDRVQIDPETGAGVWTERIEFNGNTAALTPESRSQLAELAKLLQRSPAKQFRVLVATAAERTGSRAPAAAAKSGRQLATSRAQSVADYLDRHGIAEERLAIASTGVKKLPVEEHGPTASSEDVKVFLVDPEQPVLGWLHSATLRR
jgi:outer membrane protein OmpA-like peptidoglycan-associated protein